MRIIGHGEQRQGTRIPVRFEDAPESVAIPIHYVDRARGQAGFWLGETGQGSPRPRTTARRSVWLVLKRLVCPGARAGLAR